MACDHKIRIPFKQGDSFRLDIKVRDHKNEAAIAAQILIDEAQATLDAATETVDIEAAKIALITAQDNYDLTTIVDIDGWVISSQARHGQKLIQDFTTSIDDAPNGDYSITAEPIDTAGWPITNLDIDVQMEDASFGVASSKTFIIEVQKDITRG